MFRQLPMELTQSTRMLRAPWEDVSVIRRVVRECSNEGNRGYLRVSDGANVSFPATLEGHQR
jgi:hypothetical protein